MNEYSVTVLVDASRSYTVKAESPEAAIEQAEELYSRGSSGLCHHCSGKLDVGGAVGAIAYCEDKEVLDTSYQASRIAALEAEVASCRSNAVMLEQANAGLAQLNGKLRTELAEACEVLEWIAKWGYGDGGRECAEKAAEWLEKHGANQTGGPRP